MIMERETLDNIKASTLSQAREFTLEDSLVSERVKKTKLEK